jgi:hypothetical protein
MNITSVSQQHRGAAPPGGRRARPAPRVHHAIRLLTAIVAVAAYLAIASTPASAAELLTNGSFETGNFSGWTTTQPQFMPPWYVAAAGDMGQGFPDFVNAPSPQDGTYDAVNYFDGSNGAYTLTQAVTIPAGVVAVLSWKDRLQWEVDGPTRTMQVRILNGSGSIIDTPYTFTAAGDGAVHDTGWQNRTVDLSTFAGQTVSVQFYYDIPGNFAGRGMGELDAISVTTPAATDTTPPVIAPTITGTLGDSGWYTTNAHLSWSVTDAQSTASQTGCDAVDVTADQQATSYTCTATSTGGTASETVSIKRDATAPVVSVTGVSNGATYTVGSVPTAGCDTQDSTSGVATAATLSSTGGPFGAVTKTCSGARDNAGNTASASATYSVHYAFTGFFAPIDNGNVLNEMNAGRAVPVKFSLGGNQGLDILAANSPSSQQIGCDSSLPVGAVEETTGAGSSSLSYDAGSDRYNYVWKTDSAWAGTCRQLTVTLRDGSMHTAKFKFR